MTATKCLRCEADAQQFLCRECVRRTRSTLRGLPRLLRHLAEAAVGQTRLGDIGRHTPYRSRHELDGESELASHIECLPARDQMGKVVNQDAVAEITDDPMDDLADLYESRLARQQSALRKLLAAGGVNERASTLHAEIINSLSTWIRDVCETRGVDPQLDRVEPAALCGWLNRHIDSIANHPAADEFCDELDERVRQALRIINRPIPPRYVGPCPAQVGADHDADCRTTHPHKCDTALRAPRKADSVTCAGCGTVYDDIDELGRQLLDGIDDWWLSRDNLMFTMEAMGRPLARSTFYKWRKARLLPELLVSGEPRYRVADVRQLLDAKPQTRPTGAAARAK